MQNQDRLQNAITLGGQALTGGAILTAAIGHLGEAWGRYNCTGFVYTIALEVGEFFFDDEDATQLETGPLGSAGDTLLNNFRENDPHEYLFEVPISDLGIANPDPTFDAWSLISSDGGHLTDAAFRDFQPGDLFRGLVKGNNGKEIYHSGVVAAYEPETNRLWLVDNFIPGTNSSEIQYTSFKVDPDALTRHVDTTFAIYRANAALTGSDDFIQGSAAVENILGGGLGEDFLAGGDTHDTLFGGAGDDTLIGRLGKDSIRGDLGDDEITSSGVGADTLDGGEGLDGLWLDRSDLKRGQTIDLTRITPIKLSDETSFSGFEYYNLRTGSGNDTVTVAGNSVNQNIHANGGQDRVIVDYSTTIGSVTFQRLADVALSDSTISVGRGREQKIGLFGFEDFIIYGGAGNDRLDAQYMISSKLYGNGGDDRLFGTNSTDFLFGGDGNDRIEGFNCNLNPDRLFGGAGNDTLVSTGDGSVLTGGLGDDVMTGGTGGVRFDRFVFEGFFGRDRITDFEAGPGEGDKIDLSALNLTKADVRIEVAQNGFSSRLVVTPFGGTILLEGVTFDRVDYSSDLIF